MGTTSKTQECNDLFNIIIFDWLRALPFSHKIPGVTCEGSFDLSFFLPLIITLKRPENKKKCE